MNLPSISAWRPAQYSAFMPPPGETIAEPNALAVVVLVAGVGSEHAQSCHLNLPVTVFGQFTI
jgi:hypothetical protein